MQLKSWYEKQDKKCYWCGCEMLPPGSYKSVSGETMPDTLCTYDHMYNRFDKNRNVQNSGMEQRNVAACWKCNNDRGRDAVKLKLALD